MQLIRVHTHFLFLFVNFSVLFRFFNRSILYTTRTRLHYSILLSVYLLLLTWSRYFLIGHVLSIFSISWANFSLNVLIN